MRIDGNTIFIPGATSGIGLALAVALQARGNTVVVGGRRRALLDDAADRHGLHTVEIDTADPVSIAEASARVIAEHPAVNVLVAMAGVMTVEDWTASGFAAEAERIVTTNLLGPIRLVDAFIDHLRSTGDATIMTVSSGLAFVPMRATPTYNASKAAIHMLSESIRLQLAGTGVDVIELEPPSVRTGLLPGQADNAHAMPLDRFVAEVVHVLETEPAVTEVQVGGVDFLRHAEARGEYRQVLAALNGSGARPT